MTQSVPNRRPGRLRLYLLSALTGFAAAWRRRHDRAPLWTGVSVLLAAAMALPLATLVAIAATAPADVWPQLARTVLPATLRDTAIVLVGVGLLTLAFGACTAWLVTMCRFPGRALLDRLLVLPLAMPTYIVAYAYVEILDYAGPVQGLLRALFGWNSARDYWFPDIRSMGGAILVLAAALYPYVYLSARASFVQQSVCVLEVARTLGRTSTGVFWSVALPLARPALAGGVALAAMESLNDLGAVDYLGVRTLSVSIYTAWQQQSNLGGAAQISLVAVIVVVALIMAERSARGGSRFHHSTGRYRAIPFTDLEGWRGVAAAAFCALPVVAGFAAPFALLVAQAAAHAGNALAPDFWRAARNSVGVAATAAAVTVALGLLLAYARRVASNPVVAAAVRGAGLGYALPGTVLALGLIIPLAAFDNRLDELLRATLGISTGLLLSGSLFVIVLAYVIRFLTVALSALEAGFERLSPNLDAAARALGETALSALWRVHVPLLAPALGAAALLVFVDGMKELPATLLMRPFNFETLATHVYNYAGLEQFENATPGALAIVLVGLVPVLLLHRAVAGGRAGSER